MFVPSFIALSMSSALATPSWRRLNASFIMGTRSRFTTNPGDSFTSTASLPSLAHRFLIRPMVASLVSEPRITTWKPAAAQACAMPAPIVPAPMTATLCTSARCIDATSRVCAPFSKEQAIMNALGSYPPCRMGRRTPMAPLRKPLTVALVLAMVLSSFVLIARPVAAAQNHPTWTQGDFWVYTRTAGSATSTIRIDVYEKSTLTLPLGSYDLWHITTTTTDSNGNSAVVHSWVQDSNLGTAKTTINLGGFGTVTVTYDPPVADAVFPLSAGASWSLSTTLRVVNTTFTFPIAYTAAVTTEQSTSVIAGSFNVAVISRPAAGSPTSKDHYSDSAGNHVRRESYAPNGTKTSDQQLTSYRYQAGTFSLILIGLGVAIVAAIVIAALVVTRRRRRARPPGTYPPPPETPPPPSS